MNLSERRSVDEGGVEDVEPGKEALDDGPEDRVVVGVADHDSQGRAEPDAGVDDLDAIHLGLLLVVRNVLRGVKDRGFEENMKLFEEIIEMDRSDSQGTDF